MSAPAFTQNGHNQPCPHSCRKRTLNRRADKFLPVRVDPLPEHFSENPPLRPRRAFDTHNIGRKSATITTAGATPMKGFVTRSLHAACNRLAVVISKCAGYA